MTASNEQGSRAPATGAPAPLTQEQVHELARGVADELAIAAILESHGRTGITEAPKPAAGRKRSPVRISADDLAVLRDQGRTPKTVSDRLRESERKDPPPRAGAPEQDEPGLRPRTPRGKR